MDDLAVIIEGPNKNFGRNTVLQNVIERYLSGKGSGSSEKLMNQHGWTKLTGLNQIMKIELR